MYVHEMSQKKRKYDEGSDNYKFTTNFNMLFAVKFF